jgi:hypothetical protein
MGNGGNSPSTDRIIRATAGATPVSTGTIKISPTTGAAAVSAALSPGTTYLVTCDQDMYTASVATAVATAVADDCPRWANTYWFHTPTKNETFFAGLAISTNGNIWLTPLSDLVQ